MPLHFRHAVLEDAASCAEIYRPYVEKTSITFEYIPPEEAEFARRMECYTPAFPWIGGADWENGDRLCLWVSAKYQGGLPMECGFGDLSV